MCTMTWFVNDGGYELFFNRDEHLSRSRASLPSVQSRESVTYISPTDTDAGGTWIAANQYGVTVCLLNHYQFEQIAAYKDWTSRGEIVRKFSVTHCLNKAEKEFNAMEFEDYRAFRLFLIEPSGQNKLFVWDGHQARIESNVTAPKSSSSVTARHVKAARRQLFDDLNLFSSKETASHIEYHASHKPKKSKESVCMHRDDANTVSLSHVVVECDQVSFSYADGSPCVAGLAQPLSIPLGTSSAVERLVAIN